MPLVFLAAWWMIGDLSYEGEVEGGLDYMYEPPEVPPWLTVSVGVAASCLAFVTGRPLWSRRDIRRPVAVLVVVAALGAFSARSITAGVIGANIGGALLLFFGVPPLALVGLGALLAVAWRTRRGE